MTEDGSTDDASDESPAEEQDDPRSGEFGIAEDVVGSETDDGSASDDRTANDTDNGDTSSFEDGGTNADAPLSSLASSVEERRSQPSDRPDDQLFSEESVPEIDTDVVWQRIADDDPPELPGESDHDVRVIEKRNYCEQCPFFSEPPEVSCAHDGTEILELVDMEHFRVVDCPKVREDDRLERL